jgi:hypothetical protein
MVRFLVRSPLCRLRWTPPSQPLGEEISRAVWPFVLAMLLALAIVTQRPALSTLLPALFGLA